MIALTRSLPFRWACFIDYTTKALLLKRSAGDVEFIHRLLREYFALRHLQPRLRDENPDRRLEAIRNLGFQGEAAIDSLAVFARERDPRIREAAVSAFGTMAARRWSGTWRLHSKTQSRTSGSRCLWFQKSQI